MLGGNNVGYQASARSKECHPTPAQDLVYAVIQERGREIANERGDEYERDNDIGNPVIGLELGISVMREPHRGTGARRAHVGNQSLKNQQMSL